jgi:hypothetical protein
MAKGHRRVEGSHRRAWQFAQLSLQPVSVEERSSLSRSPKGKVSRRTRLLDVNARLDQFVLAGIGEPRL